MLAECGGEAGHGAGTAAGAGLALKAPDGGDDESGMVGELLGQAVEAAQRLELGAVEDGGPLASAAALAGLGNEGSEAGAGGVLPRVGDAGAEGRPVAVSMLERRATLPGRIDRPPAGLPVSASAVGRISCVCYKSLIESARLCSGRSGRSPGWDTRPECGLALVRRLLPLPAR